MKLETNETPVQDGQQGELRIARGSRVGVRIEVIPAAVSNRRSPDQVRLGLHDSVVQPIADKLRRQGADPFVFNLVTRDFSDKIGIRVTQAVDANRIGGPYRITLIARQGRSYWSASIARPNGLNPNYQGIADDISEKENPERYFDAILKDSRMLANGLAQTIKIGEIRSCGADFPLGNKIVRTSTSSAGSFGVSKALRQKGREVMAESALHRGKVRLDRADQFRFTSATRISVDTQFAPNIAAALRLAEGSESAYAKRVSSACIKKLRSTGRPWSIGAQPGHISNDGTNVIIRLMIEPNAKGYPYRVSLLASQGDARWLGSIERPHYRHVPNNLPIQPNGTTQDGRPYWNAARDTDALAERLCNHILSGGTNANER